jgi:CheY-like chemotaxis protein
MPETRELLLIEDEAVIREGMSRALAAQGFAVDAVEDLDGAAYDLARRSYRLLIVDLMLPGRRHQDVLRLIEEHASRLPVIVITGNASSDRAVESFQAGAFDFLPKPFEIEELSGTVERAVNATAWADRPWSALLALPPDGSKYFLNRHSWAEARPDGTCIVGAGPHVSGLMGQIEEIRPVQFKENIRQGDLCARILSASGSVHQIWSPLSGTVLEINPSIRKNALLLDRDPLGEGWLMRIIPADFDLEVRILIRAA